MRMPDGVSCLVASVQIGDMRGILGLVMIMWEGAFSWIMYPFRASRDGKYGQGPLGSTALVFHRNKIVALMEAGFPYAIKFCKGLIESLGIFTYGGQLRHAMTAHAKRHPVTDDLHAFQYKCAAFGASLKCMSRLHCVTATRSCHRHCLPDPVCSLRSVRLLHVASPLHAAVAHVCWSNAFGFA